MVATAPTVYGIETQTILTNGTVPFIQVATAPTVYGIETFIFNWLNFLKETVATAPTVYGIETQEHYHQ